MVGLIDSFHAPFPYRESVTAQHDPVYYHYATQAYFIREPASYSRLSHRMHRRHSLLAIQFGEKIPPPPPYRCGRSGPSAEVSISGF